MQDSLSTIAPSSSYRKFLCSDPAISTSSCRWAGLPLAPDGTPLIRTGDTARDIFFVERGQLAVQEAGPDGTKIRLRTMTAGAIVGEVALYTRQPRGADVLALEETVVCRLSEASLARLEAESEAAAVLLHRLVAMNLSGKLTVANRLIQRARL